MRTMSRVFFVLLAVASLAGAQVTPRLNRVWTTELRLKICGDWRLEHTDVWLPGVDISEAPVVTNRSNYVVQWSTPDLEPRQPMSLRTMLRLMMRGRSAWKARVKLVNGVGQVTWKYFWVTPLGVGDKAIGPPPESSSDEEWGVWVLSHRWTHEHFDREFKKLWREWSAGLVFELNLGPCLPGELMEARR